jgi:hypothetical protein
MRVLSSILAGAAVVTGVLLLHTRTEAAATQGPAVMIPAVDKSGTPAAVQQMQALERMARFDMICYEGSFSPLPKVSLPAIALDVRGVARAR